jgi:diacylglycerol kinase family enzyme
VTPSSERPPRRPFLIVNPRSGDGRAEREGLVDAARARGIEVHQLGEGDELQAIARGALEAGADALGMAGGDGSLGLVADVAMQGDVPFVCLPAGTRNHFARDIGLDRTDLLGALDAFHGERRRIDAARVGERVFLNNVALGVYAEIVHQPGYRENKLGTTTEVLPEMLNGSRQPTEMTFSDPDGNRWDSAFLVLVSNNPYDLASLVEFGGRARIDLGCLAVSVIDASAATEFAGVAASAFLGRLERSASFHHWTSPMFTIDSTADELFVGLDGEALSFPTPLEFEILPKALRLLVPPGTSTPRGHRRPVFGRRTIVDLVAVAQGRA